MKATRDVPRFDYGLQDRILVPNVMDDGFDFFMTSQGKKDIAKILIDNLFLFLLIAALLPSKYCVFRWFKRYIEANILSRHFERKRRLEATC